MLTSLVIQILMKKSTLFVVFVFLFCPFIWAQSIILTGPSGTINSDENIAFFHNSDTDTLFITPFTITNNTQSSIRLRLRMEVISGDVYAGFSFGNWQYSRASISENSIDIPAGAFDDRSFITYMRPNAGSDGVVVKYTIFNEFDPAMAISFTISCEGKIELQEEIINSFEFSNAYPNPASSSVYFNYTLIGVYGSAEVIIRDLLGGEVKRSAIIDAEGKLMMDVNQLNSGVYFYSLVLNGEPQFTRKLVIKH